jgi:hypothetical protein
MHDKKQRFVEAQQNPLAAKGELAVPEKLPKACECQK